MNYIAYIVTALSIVGTVANSFQKRWCFVVWAFTNSFWSVFNIINGSYAQAILYAFNLAMAFIGLWKWRKNEKKKTEGDYERKN
ncbi:MAG: nicotinamide mononucleotide transporter [Clostridia bacterium]|nr:nicotinamide mononucleotide transporter [Clostridia bacterium]